MASPSQTDGVTLGALKPQSTWGEYNGLIFVIQQALSKLQTATLVKVQSCTNDSDVSPVGFVDVLPLVNQIDGSTPANPTPHATVHNLPYLRLQGGASAIIMDPQIGDIGIAIFASRDISKVKATKAQANPGSHRQYDFADGMYLGGLLNAAPVQYLQFSPSNAQISIISNQIVAKTSNGFAKRVTTEDFFDWIDTQVYPFLQSKGYVGPPPPNSSLTSTFYAE